MDVWHDDEVAGTLETVIPAALEAQDPLILGTIAPGIAAGTHSFLRAIKPDWRIEVYRHPVPGSPEDADAVADSAFAATLLRLERDGRVARTRREVMLASMAVVTERLLPSSDERRTLHDDGFRWAVANGRWDATARAGLESRFLGLRDGLAAAVAGARRYDPSAWGGTEVAAAARERWSRSPQHERGGPIPAARFLLARHANRIGVFAEPEAILHYFLFRLEGGASIGGDVLDETRSEA